MNKTYPTEKKTGEDAIVIHHRVAHNIFIAMVRTEMANKLEKYRASKGVERGGDHPADWALTEDIFMGRMGMRASNNELENVYGTTNHREAIAKILRDGEWKSQENAKGRPKTQFETDLRSR
uniref:Ribosome maturation protein SDO1/SBDS N-terminal domain-containing protein n=1 Tax=Compsopogon caeruleus TaxID=31354 RepID=A0A7S1TIX8_9RHOD|mmetsp:Transcript_897/g.1942  ORF Transcript_897/g.1942 Transcript_897/m.1942 type:complete len:122 (+) Transcript_897:85-450(+)